MKKELIIFLIYSFLVFTIISASFYNQYKKDKELTRVIVEEESKTISAILMSFIKTYQDAFIENHIAIDEKTINLLPVRTAEAMANNFSEILNNNTTIRIVFDRPRNPENKANENENKIISYFKNNPEQQSYFIDYDSTFYYAIPLYIEQSCLKCHGKKEDAISIIRDNYNQAYNYKVGELRGILSINMTKQNITQKLSTNFYNRLFTASILFLLIIIAGYLTIKVIVGNEKRFSDKLQNKVNEKTKELSKLNKNLNKEKENLAALNKELTQNIEELFASKEHIEKQKILIEQSENNFIQLLNTFSDGLYINDVDYNITYMNEPMRKQLGENKIGDKCYSAIYNLDKKCDWCIYEDLKEKNKIEYEHKIDNHSKMIRSVLLDNQSKLTVFYDITNRKEREKTLKESEEKFRKIINSANDAVILIDNNEKIAMWNIAAQKIFGYSEEEILGKNLHDILSPVKYRDAAHNAFALFRKSGKGNAINKTVELEGLRKDGSIFPIELSLSAIKINNKWNAVGIVRDITMRKEYEKAFKEAKSQIEAAHKHITDNINYAKTIQQALLTSDDMMNSYLSDYFVMFMPKDQVSGDFYYVNKFNNHIVFAAADSTGHGVSGGFLTMLGITHLHDIVSRKETDTPSRALNILRRKIKSVFKTFGSENKNGFDIALCAFDTETKKLMYAGANNPLLIIRNNELIEYKATRNPIGFYYNEIDFVNHEIQLEKDDLLYIFSDGYADQFGGPKGKKFMYKKFKNLLLSISSLPMKEQKQELINTFNQWKGLEEQTDDIVILALKI